jgi:hypothetical protein
LKEKIKYIPVLSMLVFYLLVLLQANSVARAQNDYSFIILGIFAPLPLVIAIIVALIKLSRE